MRQFLPHEHRSAVTFHKESSVFVDKQRNFCFILKINPHLYRKSVPEKSP